MKDEMRVLRGVVYIMKSKGPRTKKHKVCTKNPPCPMVFELPPLLPVYVRVSEK